MLLHQEELPNAEVPSFLVRANTPLADADASFQEIFSIGFALPKRKKKTKFTDDQIDYITEKFEFGRQATARKAHPHDVEQQMRRETFVNEKGDTKARFQPKD